MICDLQFVRKYIYHRFRTITKCSHHYVNCFERSHLSLEKCIKLRKTVKHFEHAWKQFTTQRCGLLFRLGLHCTNHMLFFQENSEDYPQHRHVNQTKQMKSESIRVTAPLPPNNRMKEHSSNILWTRLNKSRLWRKNLVHHNTFALVYYVFITSMQTDALGPPFKTKQSGA